MDEYIAYKAYRDDGIVLSNCGYGGLLKINSEKKQIRRY